MLFYFGGDLWKNILRNSHMILARMFAESEVQTDLKMQTINNKFMYDNSYESISNIDLLKEEINPTSISIINCDENIYNEQLFFHFHQVQPAYPL